LLGAWWWLAESGDLNLRDGRNHFTQEIGDSLLPVGICYEGHQLVSVVLTQSPPEFGNICEDPRGMVKALGLYEEDLTPLLPAQVVSTGAGHLLVPVQDRAAVIRAQPDPQQLAKILKAVGGEAAICIAWIRYHLRQLLMQGF
jgi:trans-2,3-dihydro-3-hydroxyanthranilate isomerase